MISSRAYLISSVVFAQTMRVMATLVIARFVLPEDFGAYAALLAAASFFTGFTDFSIPASFVQFQDVEEDKSRDTALVLGLLVYSLYTIGLIITGMVLAHTQQDDRLPWIALIFSASAMLGFVYNLQLSVLNRRKEFGRESIQNIIFSVAQALTGIGLAVAGWGIYAIVLQLLAGQLIGNILIWFRVPLRWPRQASLSLMKRYLWTGLKVSSSMYLHYVGNGLMGLFILRSLSQAALGAWNRAVQIQGLFSQNLLVALDRVFFTSMCSAPDDATRGRMMIEAFSIYFLISCGFAAWFVVAAPELVRVMLGPGWEPAIPFMQVLGAVIPAGAFYSTGHASAFSAGRASASFIGLLVGTIVLGGLFLFPYSHTESSIAWVYCVYRYVASLVTFGIACQTLKISYRKLITPFVLIALQAIMTSYLTYETSQFARIWMQTSSDIPAVVQSLMIAVIGTTVAVVVYGILTFILQRNLAKRIIQLSRKR